MDINKVLLIARLTRDPELKQTTSGHSVVTISVASGRKYKSGDEMKEETSFFDCVAWNKTAELINQYCKKGDRIGIEGRLLQRRWETDGKKNSKVEISIENIQFLSNKKAGETNEEGSIFTEEEIPF
jgi:single-strand DNA-binding protein